jgi:hypothetical protein
MATFPTTNKTFTSKSNGNTIDASHINDLQDEIAAIEDGYLNGTARLNAGASTLARLNVTGASTLATLSVTGGSTLVGNVSVTGDLTVGGVLTGAIAQPAVRVFNSTLTTLADGVVSYVNWNSQKFVTAGMHSTASNPSRLIAISSGVYQISAGLEFLANSSAGIRLSAIIRIDGSTIIARDHRINSTGGAEPSFIGLTTLYRFASSGGYAELGAYQGGASSISITASGEFPYFSMVKVG